MNTVSDNRRRRLEELIAEAKKSGTTLAQLAERIGCSAPYLSQLRHGTSNVGSGKERAMGDSLARRIEHACKKPTGWMDNVLDVRPDQLEQAGPLYRVPVVGWDQLDYWLHDPDPYSNGASRFQEVDTTFRPFMRSFAMKLRDDTMVDAAGGRSFYAGLTIVFQPGQPCEPGDFVLASRNGGYVFRQLVSDGATLYLKPLNQRYPIAELGDRGEIVARAMQVLDTL